jgi:hypothetical protein
MLQEILHKYTVLHGLQTKNSTVQNKFEHNL